MSNNIITSDGYLVRPVPLIQPNSDPIINTEDNLLRALEFSNMLADAVSREAAARKEDAERNARELAAENARASEAISSSHIMATSMLRVGLITNNDLKLISPDDSAMNADTTQHNGQDKMKVKQSIVTYGQVMDMGR